jgi:hypothetical protein
MKLCFYFKFLLKAVEDFFFNRLFPFLARIFHDGLNIDDFLLSKRNGSEEIALSAFLNARIELKTASSAL